MWMSTWKRLSSIAYFFASLFLPADTETAGTPPWLSYTKPRLFSKCHTDEAPPINDMFSNNILKLWQQRWRSCFVLQPRKFRKHRQRNEYCSCHTICGLKFLPCGTIAARAFCCCGTTNVQRNSSSYTKCKCTIVSFIAAETDLLTISPSFKISICSREVKLTDRLAEGLCVFLPAR